MIFYSNQLMKTQTELKLYLVSNPVAFARYEDHEAAIQIMVHELVESSIAEGENPIALIEDYLGIAYDRGDTVLDITAFLIQSDPMKQALYRLRESWDQMDSSAPEESLLYSNGLSREEVVRTFSQITLRTYLEALALQYNGN